MKPEPQRPQPAFPPELAAFLQNLRTAAAETPLPELPPGALREVTAADDLAAVFAERARAAGCQVQVATAADWPVCVRALLAGHQIESLLLVPDDTTALSVVAADQLALTLAAVGVQTTRGQSDETLFEVGAALTGVHGAIAETGSLVWNASPLTARGATLMPPVHIALVRVDQLVPDTLDFFTPLRQGACLPAAWHIISGPSKTADIEGILITGVHGPGTLHIILVQG